MDILQAIMEFLLQYSADPVLYVVVFFIYGVLAAVILPIPVELGLIWNPTMPFIIKALVLGAGKATGSLFVFMLGVKVEDDIRRWERWNWFKWLVEKCTWFVKKFRYVGLFVLLSIPGMVDTIPIYVFSLFNKEGELLERNWFVLVNFLGGITRAIILYLLLTYAGIDLFG